MVLPRPDHLQELRAAHGLLGVGENKVERLTQAARGHLEPVANTDIVYDLALTAAEGTDLVAMGPNAFHGRPDVGATRVRVSVTCVVLKRVHEPLRHG